MRALVTGGCGFVGRHLLKGMLAHGGFDEITVVDPIVPLTGGIRPGDDWPLMTRDQMYDRRIAYELIDCRKYFEREPDARFDVVFHLAAMVGGRLMIEHDPLAVAQDLEIDAAMFRWAAGARKMPHVVYFSSSAAYPIAAQTEESSLPLVEDDIEWEYMLGIPDMSYGWAKLTGEYLAKLARETYGMKTTIYRPFSGYGPDQDLTYPFPSIMKRAVEATDEKIFVWGPGTQQRDFIHIDDCVATILETWGHVDVLNLSTGRGTSFVELAKMAMRAAHLNGHDPIVEREIDKPVGVYRRVGDTTKQQTVGAPAPRLLEEGVAEGVRYWQ